MILVRMIVPSATERSDSAWPAACWRRGRPIGSPWRSNLARTLPRADSEPLRPPSRVRRWAGPGSLARRCAQARGASAVSRLRHRPRAGRRLPAGAPFSDLVAAEAVLPFLLGRRFARAPWIAGLPYRYARRVRIHQRRSLKPVATWPPAGTIAGDRRADRRPGPSRPHVGEPARQGLDLLGAAAPHSGARPGSSALPRGRPGRGRGAGEHPRSRGPGGGQVAQRRALGGTRRCAASCSKAPWTRTACSGWWRGSV